MKCDLFTIIQTIASVVACIIAVFIPRKISWEQMYTQLLSEYLGYDFGAAVMGIVFFFNNHLPECRQGQTRLGYPPRPSSR